MKSNDSGIIHIIVVFDCFGLLWKFFNSLISFFFFLFVSSTNISNFRIYLFIFIEFHFFSDFYYFSIQNLYFFFEFNFSNSFLIVFCH